MVDLQAVEVGSVDGVYYYDTGMFDTPGYGAVYVIDADRPALVDTGLGTNYERAIEALDELGVGREGLEVVALTHAHLDHAGGAGHLIRECPSATAYVHEIGAPHLVDPERLIEGTKRAVGDMWKYYAEPEPIPEDRLVAIEDGDRIDLGDRELVAHHAPGHAPHQVVFESPADDAVYTADAAGLYVPELDRVEPTSPPPSFDLEDVLDDVETIRELDPSALLYPHYGPARADDRLAEYERVIEEWVREIERVRADLGDDEAVIEHFVEGTDTEGIWGEEKTRAEAEMNVRGVLQYLDDRE